MPEKEIKAIYESLKASGDLQTFHPELVGEWVTDKQKFTSLYNATENLMGGLEDDEDDFVDGVYLDQF